MDPLTLYIDSLWISPYAMSCFVALEEKGLPYSVVEVSLPDKAHHASDYGARTGRIPSLRHGDFWLAESMAIAEYLAETFPHPKHPRLFPADLKERGICRELMSWLRSDLMPIREERGTHTIFYKHPTKPLSDAARASVERLLRVCERVVPEGRTTIFAEWCVADADLALMLTRLHAAGDPLPKKVAAYAEANWARPSVQKWVRHERRPYVQY